ncbi:MAG: SPOR domain-containing protein [Treponema sp.]|jgi:hypothetical protein|nr:SPOR domain-containing protein [Treponema sp.]
MENRFVHKKHIVTLAALLMAGGFSFAQQSGVRVIGAVPSRDTGNAYDVQVGAFRTASNADRAAENVRRAGYTPCYERYGNLTRVIVRGLRVPEIWPCIDRLGCAGFREVIVREKGPVTPDAPAGASGGTDATSAGEAFINEAFEAFTDEKPAASPEPAEEPSYVPAKEYGDLPHSLPHSSNPFATGSVPSGL